MEKLVMLAKIFSDVNRIKIIGLLYREKKLCVCEICDTLGLSQPLVSRHLKQMRECQIVQTTQSGKWIIYSLRKNDTIDCFLKTIEADIATLPTIISCTIR